MSARRERGRLRGHSHASCPHRVARQRRLLPAVCHAGGQHESPREARHVFSRRTSFFFVAQ
eukprot:350458-Pyramimonas_sp.AAC.1